MLVKSIFRLLCFCDSFPNKQPFTKPNSIVIQLRLKFRWLSYVAVLGASIYSFKNLWAEPMLTTFGMEIVCVIRAHIFIYLLYFTLLKIDKSQAKPRGAASKSYIYNIAQFFIQKVHYYKDKLIDPWSVRAVTHGVFCSCINALLKSPCDCS